MKTLFLKKNLLAAALLTSGSMSFAQMSGTYRVIQSDCDDTGVLFVGDQNAVVRVTSNGIKVGEILYTGDGGPSSRPYFQSALEFTTGTQEVHNLGDGYMLYVGTFSSDGSGFKDVLQYASDNGSTPVYDGEVDFKWTGDNLEIDSTMTGQPNPGPKLVCILQKVK